jgi:peptidoglycan/LPS O-acetylase OafA/YrhL
MSLKTIKPERLTAVVSRDRTGGADPMKYAPSLDGLRAVAILAVLGFHTIAACA